MLVIRKRVYHDNGKNRNRITSMGDDYDRCGTSLVSKEDIMQRVKMLLSRLAVAAVWGVAISTLASTSRYFVYQPEGEEALMRKYL